MAWSNEQIRALAEPVAADFGLEVWDVELRGSGRNRVLRVFLDRPEGQAGVTIEDCERVSRRLGDVLDAYDVIEGHYLLEVSSPGVNRALRRPEHFERSVGRRVRLRLREGGAAIVGTLEGTAGGSVVVVGDDGRPHRVELADIAEARTEFEFPQPQRRGRRKRG